jgi:hypothetical protein
MVFVYHIDEKDKKGDLSGPRQGSKGLSCGVGTG